MCTIKATACDRGEADWVLNLVPGLKEARTEGWVEEGRSCRAGTERLSVWTAALLHHLLLLLLLLSECDWPSLFNSSFSLLPTSLHFSQFLFFNLCLSGCLFRSWHLHSGSGDKRRQTVISLQMSMTVWFQCEAVWVLLKTAFNYYNNINYYYLDVCVSFILFNLQKYQSCQQVSKQLEIHMKHKVSNNKKQIKSIYSGFIWKSTSALKCFFLMMQLFCCRRTGQHVADTWTHRTLKWF